MSYYQKHIFFCVNQRENGERCCNNHHAQAMRDYAKDRIKTLKLSGKGKIRVNNAGVLTAAMRDLSLSSTLITFGTPMSIKKILTKSLKSISSTAVSLIASKFSLQRSYFIIKPI